MNLLIAILLVGLMPLAGQGAKNFLHRVYGTATPADQPLLGPAAPGFELLIASRELEVKPSAQPNIWSLSLAGIPVRFDMRYERKAGIDLYTIRHAADSELRGEQIRFTWTFPEQYNESMSFDTGALQGQPLHLPDGKIPDNHFTNWGSLFFNREANVAVGVNLEGAEWSRHARRGYNRFTKSALLQLMAITGNPKMAITLFAYRPKSERFWWAEWYQLRSGQDPDIPSNFFPILSAREPGWQPGEQQVVSVIPGPDDRGRKMDLVVIDDIKRKLVAREPFTYELPVTNVTVKVGDWRSSLYRIIVVPEGGKVDPAVNDLNRKLTNVIVRPRQAKGAVLFMTPTDMWWAYSTNGSHDYHGWRTGYDGSVGYSPTVMSSRQRRLNNFFYSLYERFTDIEHLRYLDELAARDGFEIDFATQYDVARGRVRLDDYKLVMIGNHCEFASEQSDRRFREYLGRGGAVLIHGGDSFAVRVEFLPSLEEPRYIWQRGHLWTHLSDQPSDFRSPALLPPDAPPGEPVTNPSPGSAIDYLNVFHTTVGYWIQGSKAVIANTVHPIVNGMNLKLGDEVPGPWGGEVDYPYEPNAWDILVRSDRAAPEEREFNIDAYDPTPIHRVGLAVHRNLRLAMVCGENYPHILRDPRNTLFRDLYRRTVHYLLDGTRRPGDGDTNLVPSSYRDSTATEWERAVKINSLRYELPEFIDYGNPDWHRKPAPYAHYVIQGSEDGQHWSTLVDRRHGPWRGMNTDFFAPAQVRYLRFDGTLSTGEPLRVRNMQAFGLF